MNYKTEYKEAYRVARLQKNFERVKGQLEYLKQEGLSEKTFYHTLMEYAYHLKHEWKKAVVSPVMIYYAKGHLKNS